MLFHNKKQLRTKKLTLKFLGEFDKPFILLKKYFLGRVDVKLRLFSFFAVFTFFLQYSIRVQLYAKYGYTPNKMSKSGYGIDYRAGVNMILGDVINVWPDTEIN